jgi:L-ribulose-5-phosphate 3-epimerase
VRNVACPSFQIGLNYRDFPSNWRSAREEIAFARAAGFTSMQFHGPDNGLDTQHLGDPPAAVGALLRDAGIITVMEIGLPLDAAGRSRHGYTPLDVLRANLPAIVALSCTCVHWHLGPRDPLDTATMRSIEEQALSQLAEGVTLGQQHGFHFGLEHNQAGIAVFGTPERCAATLAAIPGLGFVWDLNHTTPEQLPGYLALTPRMTMLHVSDTPLPLVNHHLPLGLGTIPFATYCRELLARGFRGPAILEIGGLPASGGYGRDTDEALGASLARLNAGCGMRSAE